MIELNHNIYMLCFNFYFPFFYTHYTLPYKKQRKIKSEPTINLNYKLHINDEQK